MRELSFELRAHGSDEEHRQNVQSSLALNLPELSVIPQHEKTLVLVGSGPSLPVFIEQIKAELHHDASLNYLSTWLGAT